MSEYRSVLERATEQFPPPELPIEGLLLRRDRRRRNRRVASAGVAVVAVVAVATALGLAFTSGEAPVPTDTPSRMPAYHHNGGIAVLRKTGIFSVDPSTGHATRLFACAASCDIQAFAWSPDGSHLAVLQTCAQNGALSVHDIRTGVSRRFPTPADLRCATEYFASVDWSPDGRRLAYSNGRSIYVIDVDGSHRTRVALGDYPRWSPDGSRIAYGNGSDVFTMNSDGTHRRPFAMNAYQPAWSPDGTEIAYVRDPQDPKAPPTQADPFVLQVWVQSIDGGAHRLVYREPGCCLGARFGGPTWSPDGTRLAVAFLHEGTIRLLAMNSDGANVRVLGKVYGLASSPAWRPVP